MTSTPVATSKMFLSVLPSLPVTTKRIGALFVIAVLLWLARVIALIFDTPWAAQTSTGIVFAILALVNIVLTYDDQGQDQGISIAVFAIAVGIVVMDTMLGRLTSARRIAAIFMHAVLGIVIAGLVYHLQTQRDSLLSVDRSSADLVEATQESRTTQNPVARNSS